MNAASILRYFLKRGIITVRKKDIFTVSKLVGSDVILGLNYSNSILTAKNKIRYFYNCKKFYTLIVRPNFGCSTKQIYSQVKRFDKSKFNNPQKKMFNLDYLKKMNNSLETIVLNKHAKLRKIKIFLENLPNTVFVRMTGSGSSLVAYFKSKKSCDIAMRQFNKKYRNYWCTVAKTI